MSPRKVRLVASLVRNLTVTEALNQLNFSQKLAAKPVRKLIDSGIANAVNNYELDKDNLFVKTIEVGEGPTLKRWLPRARGRATPLRKRTSHINLVLGELKDSGVKAPKSGGKVDAPIRLGEKAKEAEGVKVEDKDAAKKTEAKPTGEKGKHIVDPRGEGKGKHVRKEGRGSQGSLRKIFQRKSG